MGKYAVETDVSPERTLKEIKDTLKRYKAEKFMYAEDDQKIGMAFEMHGRRVRFVLPLPDRTEGILQGNGSYGSKGQFSQSKYDGVVRARYRALLLTIKAKLESVETGIESFDEAFMAQILLPDGRTMSEWAGPQLETAYSSGQMPPLLVSG